MSRPISSVLRGVEPSSAMSASTAASMRAASSSNPRWRSSMAAERMAAVGLAMPLPAMSGAEPWIGSNMDGNSLHALMQPDAE